MFRRLTVLSLAAFLAGCTFSRTVVNGHVRKMDTSWIEPGKTTKEEVVARFGLPPSLIGVKGVRPGASGAVGQLFGQAAGVGAAVGTDAEGGIGAGASRTFRWFASDTSGRQLEGGWILYPTFASSVSNRSHDIFIRFDDRDFVLLVSRTELRDGAIRLLEWREAPR